MLIQKLVSDQDRAAEAGLSWSEIIDMQEQTVNPEQKNSVYTRIQLCLSLISHLSEKTLHKSVLGHIWLWDCVEQF